MTPQVPQRLTGHTVAVVGSGPAGLAAAQQLTRAGHTVAVYERDDAIGGLLRYGVPDFKLEKIHIDRRLAQMEAEGTRFRPGVEVGRDVTWAAAAGALRRDRHRDRARPCRASCRCPGKELGGVHVAMEYLHQANAVAAGKPVEDQITAEGKHVIIIGGGDTGSDCLGTALRQGAASVTTLAIGKRPPEDRPAHQPWPTDPILFEVSSSHEEGGERDYLASTVEFVGDEPGTVRALRLATTEYLSDGRRVPTPGTEREIPADLVLVAMGFTGPEIDAADRRRSASSSRRAGWSRAPTTSRPPCPACSSPATRAAASPSIVWAIAEGRAAAAAVDTYLSGSTELPCPVTASTVALRP